MAYLLRALIVIMLLALILTTSTALGFVDLSFSHIKLAIPAFMFTMFIQAFVMFYFIGVSRLTNNVHQVLHSKENLNELFEQEPENIEEYQKKVERYVYQTTLSKRQTIPWTILMLILGSIGFLLGAAHDTGLVAKTVHSGVIYGFLVAMLIGFARQWYYLGKSHKLLREMKYLFSISDDSM